MKNLFDQFFVGFKRHPWRFFASIFLSYSVFWTIVESTTSFFKALSLEGVVPYLVMLGASVVIGVYRSIQPREIKVRIKNTDTVVTVSFGDLFASHCHKVIPVNEFFDSKLGEPVSRLSIHGVFISQCFGGHGVSLDTLVDESLKNTPFDAVQRPEGRQKRYAIGTTAVVPVNEDRYFLVALSKTDLNTLKASADIPELWTALVGLWKQVRISAGGHPVATPLLGGGLSGVGLPGTQLLQLMLLSIVSETKKRKITKNIRIILANDRFDEINLETIKNNWA